MFDLIECIQLLSSVFLISVTVTVLLCVFPVLVSNYLCYVFDRSSIVRVIWKRVLSHLLLLLISLPVSVANHKNVLKALRSFQFFMHLLVLLCRSCRLNPSNFFLINLIDLFQTCHVLFFIRWCEVFTETFNAIEDIQAVLFTEFKAWGRRFFWFFPASILGMIFWGRSCLLFCRILEKWRC